MNLQYWIVESILNYELQTLIWISLYCELGYHEFNPIGRPVCDQAKLNQLGS